MSNLSVFAMSYLRGVTDCIYTDMRCSHVITLSSHYANARHQIKAIFKHCIVSHVCYVRHVYYHICFDNVKWNQTDAMRSSQVQIPMIEVMSA